MQRKNCEFAEYSSQKAPKEREWQQKERAQKRQNVQVHVAQLVQPTLVRAAKPRCISRDTVMLSNRLSIRKRGLCYIFPNTVHMRMNLGTCFNRVGHIGAALSCEMAQNFKKTVMPKRKA